MTALDKGVPPMGGSISINDVAAQRWNLLREDLPLPVAVLKDRAVRDNSAWMKSFLADAGAILSPHGKTTMCPALFDLQIADGAWAITVSTLHQIQVARRFGFKRIFLANQLIGRQSIDYVIGELAADSSFEFLFLADSQENIRAIADAVRKAGHNRPLQVLVELGYPGGRTGCRSLEEALELARSIARTKGVVVLRGIEGFEGLLKGADNMETLTLVEDFVGQMASLARLCDAENLFAADPIILSAGGSSFYDVVVKGLGGAALSRPSMVLVRSGCYITHDSLLYAKAVDALRERNPELASSHGGLTPALEVWAYVQSRPEDEKLIAGLGKRDVSYDDQPVALTWFRPGGGMESPQKLSSDHTVTRLNDQHCHMTIPVGSPLQVGDMIGFGISHPCLTFDKWRVMHVVDENYQVVSSVRTYF
ncbi:MULTISPECIES: amino acid deaminase [unclassified Mesorhizobium]|uniref:amino acid deaminase n=1 Tax=unclassified Mesorhizobium TaxID=325217 RepID=UPI001FEDF799|nr:MULTISPECIES: amino acid deaminase [unclassified Mesorhizobium]